MSMSREIKFRAWNSMAKKILHFGNPIGIMDNEDRYGTFFESLEGKMYCGGNYELMQYTGLKDKNGKEIYEGDIVSVMDLIGPTTELVDSVTFENGAFRLTRVRDFTLDECVIEHIEVIGNIYENPELLEEK